MYFTTIFKIGKKKDNNTCTSGNKGYMGTKDIWEIAILFPQFSWFIFSKVLGSQENIYIGFPGGSVKHLPAMRETRVRILDQEDPLEKEMAIHSSTLAWKIPRTEEPDRLQSMGSQRVNYLYIHYIVYFKSIQESCPKCLSLFFNLFKVYPLLSSRQQPLL